MFNFKKQTKEKLFWNWFRENHTAYQRLGDVSIPVKESRLEKFSLALQAYHQELSFEIGGDTNGKKELIISAGGRIEFFKAVEDLVNVAPRFNEWEIFAFKPAMGRKFKMKYEGIIIDTSIICFLLNERSDSGFDIHLFFENYSSEEKSRYLAIAHILFHAILGEKLASQEIHNIFFQDRQTCPKKARPLEFLPDELFGTSFPVEE